MKLKPPASLSPRPHHESKGDALGAYEGFSTRISGTFGHWEALANAGFSKPGTGVCQREMAGGLEKIKGQTLEERESV